MTGFHEACDFIEAKNELERRVPLRTQEEINASIRARRRARRGDVHWLGWLIIASAVFYGLLLGHAVLWLIRWAV